MAKENDHKDYEPVPKTPEMRIVELNGALQLLRDAIGQAMQGNSCYLSVMSAQMRSLLIEKTNKRNPSLLLEMADHHNVSLKLYRLPGVDDSQFPLKEKPNVWISSLGITTEKRLEHQIETEFNEVLSAKCILLDGTEYTAADVIRWFANHLGGAHYSRTLPPPFAKILDLPLLSRKPIDDFLIQFAEVTLEAGLKIQNSLKD